jgi:NADH-quinone oxidoreductase subunit N
MSLLELQALLPQLIMVLGSTVILVAGAWWRQRRLWLLTGVVLALAAALLSAFVEPPVANIAGMFITSLYARVCGSAWSLVIAATLLLSCRYADLHRYGGGEYTSLLLFAGAGMSLLSAATSFLGLFLSLEAFTLVLYILIAFNRVDNRGAEAGLKYLVFGAVSTAFIAFGIALIYSATGTLQIDAAMAGLQLDGGLKPLGLAGWALLLVAVGFKISLVPFHFWTPDVYQGAPAPIAGVMATAAKGAVLAAFLPLLNGLGDAAGDIRQVLWLLAVLTMLVGTFSALTQSNLKRMLAYSSVTHMGYLLIALLVGGSDGAQALIFYLLVYTFATFGAFAVITSWAQEDQELQDYAELEGLGYLHPRRSIALAVFMLSLAGVPPLAGFFGKFGIFHAALQHGYLELAVIGVIASLFSLYYYLRPVIVLFMQQQPQRTLCSGSIEEYLLLGGCCAAILFFGVYPGPLLDLLYLILP